MPPESPDLPLPIEDYALIGDCLTAALVGRNGSIDWLCLPHFDSGACFAALLGDSRHGRWLLTAAAGHRARRRYLDSTMVLETTLETDSGTVCVLDFMPTGQGGSSIVRIVRGIAGRVPMHMVLTVRFDYGCSIPWVTRFEDHEGIRAVAGPDMVVLRAPVPLHGHDFTTVASFQVAAGESFAFALSHGASHLPDPPPLDAEAALAATIADWQDYAAKSRYHGRWRAAVDRSLLTLRALTYSPTGGIVAAVTTSLPEQLGGARNWDYRYCWLRDAALTLMALMRAGCTGEAASWRDWLQRAIAGTADQIQIMYGLHGERRLEEWEVDWLPGYAGSRPVRIGNGAAAQVQLDVYGEIMECLHQARQNGLQAPPHGWALQRNILEHLTRVWRDPDESMWEVRGGARHFTFSKIMCWVAVDRMVRDAETFGLAGPIDAWRALREEIRATVLAHGVDAERGCFVQSFGSRELDASLLLIPVVGFLPPGDPRVVATVRAVEQDLLCDGFVLRYRTESNVDGLPAGEGAFLACTFWLATAYQLQGREREARSTFERLLGLCNDLGLLSEEYDSKTKRLIGNFPQAFSHVALIVSALALDADGLSEEPRAAAD